MTRTIIAALLGVASALAAPALAQRAPDTQNGRYSFTPVREGLIRLDVKTGEVSTCKATVDDWACYVTPQERTAFDAEIGRLRAENARLKSELAARPAAVSAEPAKTETAKTEIAKPDVVKPDVAKPEIASPETANPAAKVDLKPDVKSAAGATAPDAGKSPVVVTQNGRETTIALRLPSEEEIGQVKSLVARAWQRLVDAVGRLQREMSGRG